MDKKLTLLSNKILEKLQAVMVKAEGSELHNDLINISKSLEELDDLLRNLNFEPSKYLTKF